MKQLLSVVTLLIVKRILGEGLFLLSNFAIKLLPPPHTNREHFGASTGKSRSRGRDSRVWKFILTKDLRVKWAKKGGGEFSKFCGFESFQ